MSVKVKNKPIINRIKAAIDILTHKDFICCCVESRYSSGEPLSVSVFGSILNNNKLMAKTVKLIQDNLFFNNYKKANKQHKKLCRKANNKYKEMAITEITNSMTGRSEEDRITAYNYILRGIELAAINKDYL